MPAGAPAVHAPGSAERFRRMLRAAAPARPDAEAIAARRRRFAALMGFGSAPPGLADAHDLVMPGPAGPLPLRLHVPRAAATGGAGLVFFHGGGLVAGSLDTHDALCRRLAAAIGCRVIAVGYRLAPEHPFPAGLHDAVAAADWVMAHATTLGLAPGRIAVGGDSAGATLAAVVCRLARATPPAYQLLLCPITDFRADTPSRRAHADDPLVGAALLRRDLALYLPHGVSAADPRVSPLRAEEFGGLPPLFLHTAEHDPLRDEGARYADRLRAAGTPVRHTCHPGMIHLFYALDRVIPYAAQALDGIGREIRAAAGP